jgi:FkbM family methyltransferase
MQLRLEERWGYVRALGFRNAYDYRRKRSREGGVFELRSRQAAYPLRCRAGTSDIRVFWQIFVKEDYSAIKPRRPVRLIVDCGANVGYSAAYLLTRFPDAEVIALEPDPANYELLVENMRPYGTRIRTINAAVWSRPTAVRIRPSRYRDGLEWTRQVEEGGAIQALDIDSVTSDPISILKVDIEGAEAVVFGDSPEWLSRVDLIAIEIHDDTHFGDARAAFMRAMRAHGFEVRDVSREVTVAARSSSA